MTSRISVGSVGAFLLVAFLLASMDALGACCGLDSDGNLFVPCKAPRKHPEALVVAVSAETEQDGDEVKPPQVGDAMPGFALKSPDGEVHSLADHKKKVVVVVFSSHKCPWSKAADPSLAESAKAYAEKGVVFIGIDSGSNTTPDEVRAYTKKQGTPYPVVKDPKNVYADRVGATRTPEAYVVDAKGVLVYHGAVDNRKKPTGKPTVSYLEEALDDVLAGREVRRPEVSAWGCGIKRVR